MSFVKWYFGVYLRQSCYWSNLLQLIAMTNVIAPKALMFSAFSDVLHVIPHLGLLRWQTGTCTNLLQTLRVSLCSLVGDGRLHLFNKIIGEIHSCDFTLLKDLPLGPARTWLRWLIFLGHISDKIGGVWRGLLKTDS